MQNFDPHIDYYEILQVHPSAHQEVIKRAYRTIVGLLQNHPDLGGAHEKAVRLNEAYRVLSNGETRKAYDDARRLLTSTAAAAMHTRATTTRTYATNAGYATKPKAPEIPPVNKAPRHNGHYHGLSSNHTQVIRCIQCGAKNRIMQLNHQYIAVCGKCHTRLLIENRPQQRQPSVDITKLRLQPAAIDRLITRGEIILKRTKIPADHRFLCLRCNHRWIGYSKSTFPEECPSCHSQHWSEFRVFRCRHCAHQFSSTDIDGWPYKLFPQCPSCHATHWHVGCEKHPFRWIYNKLRSE